MDKNCKHKSLKKFFQQQPLNFSLVTLSLIFLICFTSCSLSKQISKQAQRDLFRDSSLSTAHIGISIFEPATGKHWYSYQAEKYFVPASNTKLFSLYAGMKYLGDSLPAAGYVGTADTLFILPTGNPDFLHRDFKAQKLFNFLKSFGKPIAILNSGWKENALGPGWSWDDYNDDYMVERSAFPIYGNTIIWKHVKQANDKNNLASDAILSDPVVHWRTNFTADTVSKVFFVKRNVTDNIFDITFGKKDNEVQEVPFVTNGIKSAVDLLKDTLKLDVTESSSIISKKFSLIYSQPSDSLYKIMMHRSDNFFAEQVLLMACNQKLGYMNSGRMIDTILNSDLKDIPQMPKWVDGSGLSRYNLFSPDDFVYILNKMKNEFGLEILKTILPTGGTGTLRSYYVKDSGFIYAKTGTLSNTAALSGFLLTKKNKLLIFSILSNNFFTGATPVRKASEIFLKAIRERY